MATDVERLVVSLEASITKYERAMQRALGQTNATAKKIESRFAQTQVRIGQSFTNAGALIGKAFAGAAALRGAQLLIDASTRVQNSLKVAGLEGEALTQVYDSLFAAAQKNAAPLEALVDLYGKASQVQKDLGVSTEELLGFTENVAVALRVSGKSAEESSGALLQLSQLLGTGTVRAEEFNSVQEGALPVLQAVAAGLEEAGGSVSKLRALVIDGKVSSEAFFRAFEAGSVILTEKVANSELTVSQSFIRLQNVLIDTAGKFDTATGASDRTGDALQILAAKIEQIGDFFEQNAGPIGETIDNLVRFVDAVNDIPGVNPVQQFTDGVADLADGIGDARDAIDGLNADVSATTGEMLQSISETGAALGEWSTQLSPELAAKIQEIITTIDGTKPAADEAARAIEQLGQKNPDFSLALFSIGNLIAEMSRLRGAALATASAVANATSAPVAGSAGENISDQRAEQMGNRPKPEIQTVSIDDYKPVSSVGAGGVRAEVAAASPQRRISKRPWKHSGAVTNNCEKIRHSNPR